MKIITRYIVREFFKLWLFGVVALGGLVLISEFFRELRTYLTSQAGFLTIARFLLLSFPHWALQGLPLATMLAVLFVLTRMGHRNEITAIKSSGININIIIRPFLVCGVIVTILALVLENWLIPYWARQARLIKEEKILHHPVVTPDAYYHLLTVSENREIYIGKLNADGSQLRQLLLVLVDKDGKTRIYLTPAAGFSNGDWLLSEAMIHELNLPEDNFILQTKKITNLKINLDIAPTDLLPRFGFNPEEMTFADYKMFLDNLRKLGYWQTKTWIQFYRKFSEPLTNLVVVLVALSIGLSFSSASSRLFNFTISLVLAALYSLLSALGTSCGEIGLISPIMAASLGLIIFGVAGFLALSRIRR